MASSDEWRSLSPSVAALLLAALTFGAALALGGVFAYACGLLAVCAGVLMAFAPLPTAPRQGARALLWLGVGLIVYTGLTVTPLPLAWLAQVAPAQAAVWERALRPLGATPAWATLSLDPTATQIEITKLLLYGAAFVVALGIAERRHGTRALERIVYGVMAAVVLISLTHWALGETLVLGIYQPEFARDPRHVTVFLNANHLAEVMAIGGAVAAGVLVTAPERPRQIEAALALALATLGSAAAASRGGLIALAVGVGVALLGSKSGAGLGRARLVTLGALLVGGLGVAVVAGSDAITQEAFSQDLEKLDIFRQSLPLLFRYGLFGIGRGAFESVSPESRRDLGSYVFTHPENVLLQWSIEWGILVTVVVVVVVARALRPDVLRGRAHRPWGAYAALLAFGLQNQVDFGSEVPAVMLLVMCCLALVTGGARATSAPAAPTSRLRAHAPRLLGACAMLAGALTFHASDHELWVESRDLSHELREREFPDKLRAAMLRHPAEPHFAYLGALRATLDRTPVLPWGARVLERSPVHGRAHLLIARALETTAPAQARLEYRLAFVEDYRTRVAVAEAAVRLVGGFDDATELVPRALEAVGSSDAAGARVIRISDALRIQAASELASGMQLRLPATRERLLTWVATDVTPSATLLAPLARDAVDEVAGDAPWCAQQQASCLAHAQDLTRRWLALAPHDSGAYLAAASLIAHRDPPAALQMLATAESHVDEPTALLLSASELAERHGLDRSATELLEQAVARCSGLEACASVLGSAIAIEQRRGRSERALVLLRRKTELLPHEAPAWRELAAVAEKLGLFTESGEALEQVALLIPNDAAAAEGLKRIRAAERKRALPKLPVPR